MVGLLATLVSGALLILAEVLLRDGYDRFVWGIVWFAALGVLTGTIIWWGIAGRKLLRRVYRHWRRSRSQGHRSGDST